jgi:tetratricopeptide (TPR) repeat protein
MWRRRGAGARRCAGPADIATVRGWYRLLNGGAVADEDFALARNAVNRAQALDPQLAEPYASLGALLYNEGQFAESEMRFQQAFALNPNHALGHHWHAHLLTTRGRPDLALVALGRAAEALENARVVRQHPTLQPRWWCDSQAIHAWRAAGAPAEAAEFAGQVMNRLPEKSPLRGFVLAALGRAGEAVPYLEWTPPTSLARFFSWTMWDPVRADPRVPEYLAKSKCLQEYKLARETLARMAKG